jgi:hypothetical protein
MIANATLYLETSVFGFYYDSIPANRQRRQAVIELFAQIAQRLFRAVTSPVTVDELDRAAQPLRTRLISLLEHVELIEVERSSVERLAGQYLAEGVISKRFADDARRVAYATIARCDVLVSLNLVHIANEWAARRINSLNMREGYPLLSIRTPEEVLHYEG